MKLLAIRNLPTEQHRMHHNLQQRLFRASKTRLGELIMFVGCVARRRISKEKVIYISRRVILKAQFLVVSKQHLFWLFDAFF